MEGSHQSDIIKYAFKNDSSGRIKNANKEIRGEITVEFESEC